MRVGHKIMPNGMPVPMPMPGPKETLLELRWVILGSQNSTLAMFFEI